MERTVPYTASEEVELYLRTYYSLLRSSSEVSIRTLEEVHSGMNSLLHKGARDEVPDMSAFIYSILRLPSCVPDVRLVVLSQSIEVCQRHGYSSVEYWQDVSAKARRRRCFYDGQETLVCIIASRSDIDDVIPLLTAYQIEWNKIHRLLQRVSIDNFRLEDLTESQALALSEHLKLTFDDLARLRTIWGNQFAENLRKIKQKEIRFSIQLLSGSLSEYRRATQRWWENIAAAYRQIADRPVYFVSSNTHSLTNLLSGFALLHADDLLEFLKQSNDENLHSEWENIKNAIVPSSRENFFYYLLKKLLESKEGARLLQERQNHEADHGILRIPSQHYFDVDAQIIDIADLDAGLFDTRIRNRDYSWLSKSDALILNIDYPLGLAAYNILSEVADNVGSVLGVYIMGKAATLNGVVGDVMIPNVVHDEHSRNTFIFSNAFDAASISPFLVYGSVLDNQKAVTVRGTFLQNSTYMDVFYREGYTDIEMEAGPYLSAVYEMYRPKRHPIDEIVNLYQLPFDLGIIHYASDTPLSKGKNLGAGTLSYYGMDPTYASTIAIINRIFEMEYIRLNKEGKIP